MRVVTSLSTCTHLLLSRNCALRVAQTQDFPVRPWGCSHARGGVCSIRPIRNTDGLQVAQHRSNDLGDVPLCVHAIFRKRDLWPRPSVTDKEKGRTVKVRREKQKQLRPRSLRTFQETTSVTSFTPAAFYSRALKKRRFMKSTRLFLTITQK